MHQIRLALRGTGVILMGKNTMVRRVLRNLLPERPELAKLQEVVKGNVGFVFTKGDLKEVRTKIQSNRVAAPAKAGALAPVDVIVPAGNTGMGPEKTSFFQALGVPTKISRGTIEIINDVHLIKKETRVGASEAALLNMLNISPFTYGLGVIYVYDNGTIFSPDVLDVDESTFLDNLQKGITNIAAISLALGIPNAASAPHMLVNGYKNILGVALATEISFPAADKVHFLPHYSRIDYRKLTSLQNRSRKCLLTPADSLLPLPPPLPPLLPLPLPPLPLRLRRRRRNPTMTWASVSLTKRFEFRNRIVSDLNKEVDSFLQGNHLKTLLCSDLFVYMLFPV
jgi:large subunit ribosomal protein LP0